MATVLTNVGEDWAAQRMAGSGALSALDGHFVAWGSGARPTAAKADTALSSESPDEARAVGTVSVVGSGSTAKYQVVGTITCLTNAKTITETGNFTASSVGSLIVHGDFAGIALSVGDSIQFTTTIDPS